MPSGDSLNYFTVFVVVPNPLGIEIAKATIGGTHDNDSFTNGRKLRLDVLGLFLPLVHWTERRCTLAV